MANKIVDINELTVRTFVEENRPAIEIRDQLDLGYSYIKGVIELFEIRPIWSRPSEYQQLPFAKIKYVKTQKIWKLYWMRASGKWQSYEPHPESNSLDKMLVVIDEDAYGCFKG